MKKTLAKLICVNITIIALTILSGELFGAQIEIENPVLKWKPGDRWQVNTKWHMGVHYRKGKEIITKKAFPYLVQFEVTCISTSNYGQCYMVNMVNPRSHSGIQDAYIIYYDYRNGRLVAVANNTLRSDGTRAKSRYKYSPNETVPSLIDNAPSAIRLDQPLFSNTATNLIVQQENREIRQQIVLDEKGKGFTTIITVKSKNGDERRIVQKWEPGLPWWKELKEYKGGELIAEQELALDDGKAAVIDSPKIGNVSQQSTNNLTE